MILKCVGTGSNGNCYLLKDSKEKMLLIEAGLPIAKIKKAIGFNIRDLEGCIVSHKHLDHSASVVNLRIMGAKAFMPYEMDEWRADVRYGDYRIRAFDLTNGQGRFVHTNGDGSECENYGFLISHHEMGTLVYFTDCEFCKYTFRKLKVNHFLIGVNYQKEYAPLDDAKLGHVVTGHMSEDTALEFIRVNQTDALQNVIACHLSEESCNADKLLGNLQNAVSAGVNVQIAVPGLETELYKDCPFG